MSCSEEAAALVQCTNNPGSDACAAAFVSMRECNKGRGEMGIGKEWDKGRGEMAIGKTLERECNSNIRL